MTFDRYQPPLIDPRNTLGGQGVPDYLADWQDEQDELSIVGTDAHPATPRHGRLRVAPLPPDSPAATSSCGGAPGPSDDLPDLAA